jgi:hypothetical protein
MKRQMFGFLVMVALVVGSSACAKKAPAVSPDVQAAAQATRVIAILDVLNDAAKSMNAQTPKLLSDSATAKVVSIHQSLVQVIGAAPSGWKATVQAALGELSTAPELTAAEHAKIAPYVVVAEAALSVVN